MPLSLEHNSDGTNEGDSPRLAYLLSAYPAISHTFLLNEVVELRKRGFVIDVASINKPRWHQRSISSTVESECGTTFYVKQTNVMRAMFLFLRIVLTCPSVMFRGLVAATSLGGTAISAQIYSMLYLAEALIVGDWLRRAGHTHLHIHFGGPVATVGMLTSLAWRIPYSLSIHGPEEFYNTEKFHLRKKIERAQFVLCISDHCRSQLMKLCEPAQWKKLHVARLGVDVGLFVPQSARKTSDSLEIVCVGRLVPDKGQLVLLRAFLGLVSRGHRLRLRLIGDGSERPRVEKFIIDNNLGDSVILEGALSHDATRKVLGVADIFVLASFAEGLPVALMEAMAMEIPCVSTYIAGIPELIRQEVDGLLIPASSEGDLTAALERLILNEDLRRSLGSAGRRRVAESYNLDTNMAAISSLFKEQLGRVFSEVSIQSRVGRPAPVFNSKVTAEERL